jgi:inorganic pyrophosphatase
MSAMVYPANYGFIPSTLAEDGDALDVIIYNATPIDRGTLVECSVIGCLNMNDGGENDYKVLASPTSHVRDYVRLGDVDQTWLTVAENFFQHYKELDGKDVTTNGWLRREPTYDIINRSKIIV